MFLIRLLRAFFKKAAPPEHSVTVDPPPAIGPAPPPPTHARTAEERTADIITRLDQQRLRDERTAREREDAVVARFNKMQPLIRAHWQKLGIPVIVHGHGVDPWPPDWMCSVWLAGAPTKSVREYIVTKKGWRMVDFGPVWSTVSRPGECDPYSYVELCRIT